MVFLYTHKYRIGIGLGKTVSAVKKAVVILIGSKKSVKITSGG